MPQYSIERVRFDLQTRHAFIGDYNGTITMLKIEPTGYKPITTLRGHSSAIRCLVWDPQRQMLFSGGFDQMIVCWDIGGKRGTAYELQGHHNKVTSLCYSANSQVLLSSGEDAHIVAWDMRAKRIEVGSQNLVTNSNCLIIIDQIQFLDPRMG